LIIKIYRRFDAARRFLATGTFLFDLGWHLQYNQCEIAPMDKLIHGNAKEKGRWQRPSEIIVGSQSFRLPEGPG
jgi:hypothetical protein